jgi:exopolysaccharide biosynthesis polyprenyl glycosylphosphotransferase
MLREHATIFRRMMIAADVCLLALSSYFVLFSSERFNSLLFFPQFEGLFFLLVFVWVACLHHFGMYQSFRLKRFFDIILIIFQAAVVAFIVLSSIVFLIKFSHPPRLLLVKIFAIGSVVLCVEKLMIMMVLRFVRQKGYNYRNILIVGTGSRARRFISSLRLFESIGFKVVGIIDKDAHKTGEFLDGYQIMGSLEDIPDIIRNNIIDEIVFIVPRSWIDTLEPIIHHCELQGLRIHLAVDHFNLKTSYAKLTEFCGFPLLTFESTSDKIWQLIVKRFLDFVLSMVFLILFSPVFLIVSIIIKTTSIGPIFFRQKRCTVNGRQFTLYKFRTMDIDAEEKLEALRALNEMSGPVFKLTNDPRVTPVGKFLRKFSIDEVPQFWNVLKGEMSIVGPRPPLPSEVEKYDTWQRRRLSMRPGITCLWQVGGRNEIIDFNEWMVLDLQYIDNWSLALDAQIIMKTVPVVLLGVGAK